MYSKIIKIKKAVCDVYKWLSMALIAVLLVIMVIQVFYRYILNNSLSWSEELARFIFVWASMMGAAVVTANRGHAAIKMLDGIFPKTVNDIKKGIFDLIAIAIGVALTYFGVKLVNSVWHQTSAAMKLPYAYVYMAIPTGGFGIAFASLMNFLEILFGGRKESQASADMQPGADEKTGGAET